MASGLSNSAKDNRWDFINNFKATVTDIREILPKTARVRGNYSGGRRAGKNESLQPDKSISSDHGEKYDVFLSHSGKQKNFARQLYRDLANQGVSCLFDRDCESSRVAEHFPSLLLDAAMACKVAVLLISKDFLESKRPMLELSAFMKAKETTNPSLIILPLFFMISRESLTADNGKWKEFEMSKKKRIEWCRALRVIREIEGIMFREVGDEVQFRAEIVKKIWHILPTPSPRYHFPCMQGELRMCQEVENFLNKVPPNEKGIRIVGLYGIAGVGKTTLGKAFCNSKLGDFEGKVCYLEFSRGDPFERSKLALQYLTHRPESYVHRLTNHDQANVELCRGVKRQRVLLVLDNITEESIEEATYYLRADLGENSCILLSARSVDLLVEHFNIDKQSCMRLPRLKEEEAIAILLERAFPGESTLGAEDRGFALKCANRCLLKETNHDIVPRARTFHPLALKAVGSFSFSKYGSNLSKWAVEIDSLADRPVYGLDDVFAVLGKSFDHTFPKYRTIFMLLTLYMLPNVSSDKATEWIAVTCNEEISFIRKAVEYLRKKAFVEEFEPEIRIHDLCIEFAQSKANEMGRWLWWKGNQHSTRGLISEDKAGFELAKIEECMYRNPSHISPNDLKNLLLLQVVGVRNMSKLDLGQMDSLRCISLSDCKDLVAVEGLENLLSLAWIEIRGVNPMFKLPNLSKVIGLQHLVIDVAVSHGFNQLGYLTDCAYLREIYVRCPSLAEFPTVNGLLFLESVKFSLCDKVKGPLDCTDCVRLQSIVLDRCHQMAASPLVAGCNKLSKIVLRSCEDVTACLDIDVPSSLKTLELFISSKAASAPKNLEYCYELENLELWNMRELKKLPGSFRSLSNLTVLKLVECGIREPPDLTCCVMLEDVSFYDLKDLERLPNFSMLRELKKLSLCECTGVQDPPDIIGCHKLQVFHLVHNDNMEGLPKMGGCPLLEEIKLSWLCEDEVTHEAIPLDNLKIVDHGESLLGDFKFEDVQNIRGVNFPEALKELRWLKGSFMRVKQYCRGMQLYYSILAPFEQ